MKIDDVKIRPSNVPVRPVNGYYTVILKNVTVGIGIVTQKSNRDGRRSTDDKSFERFEFVFEVEGTASPITIKLYTGTTISTQSSLTLLSESKARPKHKYNLFTTMCIQLSLLKEEDLVNFDETKETDLKKKLANISNLNCKCLIKKNEEGFLKIDPTSLTVIDSH